MSGFNGGSGLQAIVRTDCEPERVWAVVSRVAEIVGSIRSLTPVWTGAHPPSDVSGGAFGELAGQQALLDVALVDMTVLKMALWEIIPNGPDAGDSTLIRFEIRETSNDTELLVCVSHTGRGAVPELSSMNEAASIGALLGAGRLSVEALPPKESGATSQDSAHDEPAPLASELITGLGPDAVPENSPVAQQTDLQDLQAASEQATLPARREPAGVVANSELEGARSVLRVWATRRLLVDSDRWDGELALIDESLVKGVLTRMVHYRREAEVFWPPSKGIPSFPRFDGHIESLQVPEVEGFDHEAWYFIREGTETVKHCHSGCINGQQSCSRCNGGRATCGKCGGSGQTRQQVSGNGQIRYVNRRCDGCAGQGDRICGNCNGGWVRCGTCDGAGEVYWAMQATLEHVPEAEELGGNIPVDWGFKGKDVLVNDWIVVHLSPGTHLPPGIPDELAQRIASEIQIERVGEQMRKLELKVLPVKMITRPGSLEISPARLVGSRNHVVARGARSSQKTALLVAYCAGSLALIGVSPVLTVLAFAALGFAKFRLRNKEPIAS